MTLSICIITKNEESNISKCIESVYDIADEIIITDTGSIDKTIEIASSFDKVKIFNFDWENDNSKARNYCISKAKSDWILVLDADEQLDKTSSIKVQKILSDNSFNDVDVFKFKYINKNPYSLFKSHFKSSLFRNNKKIEYKMPIHDFPINKIGETNYILLEDIEIIHNNGTSLKELQTKAISYVERINKELDKELTEVDRAFYYNHLGDAYSILKESKKASICYEKGKNEVKDKDFGRGLLNSLLLKKGKLALTTGLSALLVLLSCQTNTNVSSINKPIVSSLKESKFKIKEYYRGAPIGAVLFQYIDFYGNLQEEFRCPENLYPPRNDPPSCGCGEQVEYDVYGHDLIINGSIAGYCQYETNSRCVQKSQCGPVDNPDPDPTPIPEEDGSCDENAPPLLPEDINNLLQILGQYLLPDALNSVIEKVNDFTSDVNKANNLAGQYGFSTQATKEEKAKVKYDAFVEQINQSKQELLTESANLKTVANNILNEVKTKSNINKQLLSKETDFNVYKLKVEELVDEFNYLVTDENTFSLAEASAVYGQEVGLLAEIIEDYANRVLPVKISNEEELEQYQDDENGFEKIQTTKGLIRYLKARIEGQKTRLEKQNLILDSMHKTIPFLEELSLKMEDKLNFIQSLLNDNSYSSKSYFSVKSLHPEDNIPKRDLLEFNRVQQRFATNESSLEQFKEYYTDALQEMSELQKKKLEGSKTDDNGVPILDSIKEKGNQIRGIKQTIERIGNEISKDKENTDVKINQYKACIGSKCKEGKIKNFLKDIANDPKKNIWGKTPQELSDYFKSLGYITNIKNSTYGSKKAVLIYISSSELPLIEVHPGGGIHEGAYYRLSTSTDGMLKIIDPNTYKKLNEKNVKYIPIN